MKERMRKAIVFFFALFAAGGFFLWKNINKENKIPKETVDVREKPEIQPAKEAEEITVQTPSLPSFKIEKPAFWENKCNLYAYGGMSDGKTKNTEVFQRAITDCSQRGGGTVIVPRGVWLTGPIHLEDNINLHLEEDAEIIFTQDLADYLPAVFTRFEGVEILNFSPLIYARDKTNLAITGKGKINGNSKEFWWKMPEKGSLFGTSIKKIYEIGKNPVPLEQRVFGKEENGIRPNFIEFINCDRIFIEDVEIVDGPMWTIHPVYSQNILIQNISVNTHKGNNTDGVVIDSSRNVLIENSHFATGDDAIAIKSGRDADGRKINRPSENIVARNIEVEEGHAGFAIGSEVSGDVRNVFASNFSVKTGDFGLRLKSGPTRGGKVENIFVENFKVEFSDIAGFEIDLNYGRGEETGPLPDDIPTDFENVTVENFYSQKSRYPFLIKGYPGERIENIAFKNVEIISSNDARIYDAKNITFENLRLIPSKGKTPEIKSQNTQNISIKKSAFSPGQIDCEKKPCEFSFE